MYQCRCHTIAGDERKVLSEGQAFLARWKKEAPKTAKRKPYVWVRCFGGRHRVFWGGLRRKLEKLDQANRVGRYRLMPCLKELLERTREKPVLRTNENEKPEWELVGESPGGQVFIVGIGQDDKGELYLATVYPVEQKRVT